MIAGNDAQRLYNHGNVLAVQNRYAEALISYERALTAKPNFVEALHNRGIMLRNLGQPAAALASHDRALAIRPNDAAGHSSRGLALFELKRYEEALAAHDKALAIRPDLAEACNNRGNALFELKDNHAALAAFDKAIVHKSGFVEAFNNRGNALAALGHYPEALQSYDRAIALRPSYVEALYNRADVMLRYIKRPAEALASLDRALAIAPHDAEGHFNRGIALLALKRHEDALAAYDKALALNPSYAEALTRRGTVLSMLKRPTEAAASYRRALESGADSEEITYLLAGLGAAPAPRTAPKKFITALFDEYADSFDEHLAVTLKYQAPALIFDGIARVAAAGSFDVLDLGCGTGLVGARFRPRARALIGVDLSPNMLEKARNRRIYDQLICADATEFLQDQASKLDVVVAGDLFIYIGDLSEIFHAVKNALRSGGLFGFSVEESDRRDFVLGAKLRYAHSVDYLQKLANENRLALESIESAVIRQEAQVDVKGCVVVMRLLS